VLTEGPALVEDPAWLDSPAPEEAVRLLGPAVEVDRECSVDILCVVVWRWDGG
jgi:hypothetical protein